MAHCRAQPLAMLSSALSVQLNPKLIADLSRPRRSDKCDFTSGTLTAHRVKTEFIHLVTHETSCRGFPTRERLSSVTMPTHEDLAFELGRASDHNMLTTHTTNAQKTLRGRSIASKKSQRQSVVQTASENSMNPMARAEASSSPSFKPKIHHLVAPPTISTQLSCSLVTPASESAFITGASILCTRGLISFSNCSKLSLLLKSNCSRQEWRHDRTLARHSPEGSRLLQSCNTRTPLK